ncbi:YceH family protein [Pelomicrobium sp.]|jgi:uncharacterized protein YceH (UPF0502 family)|uniref:YceH family protein n=1 Tax=Pelomicrobium sp. TaxID=2815319 RepID=UPI002FDDE1A1
MPNASTPLLSPVEARILAVLVEKQRTVPDAYPLSLNALVAGCNQKSSREPVMSLEEAEVQAALTRLKAQSLVIESSGGRVMRYAHNMEKAWQIPSQSVALLAVLMLRGPQTPGELRLHCERLHKFADLSAVEGFLRELAQRPAGALVAELPRSPGMRESRWTHLLCGTPSPAERASPATAGEAMRAETDVSGLLERVARLEAEVAALKARVAELRTSRDDLP